ncbi:MAG: HD domain-containing protein [Pseudonocardia sp.]
MTPEDVVAALHADDWPQADRERGHRAAALAVAVYNGVTRDQGTPYLLHPVAVAEIVRDDARLDRPDLLVVAVLHDALEIRPDHEHRIARGLGQACTAALRALTPDHRLVGRRRGPGDDDAYQRKVCALPDGLLTVKLADRLHNLRDLLTSSAPGRADRFLAQLTGFYLPLADRRAADNPAIDALARLLRSDLPS